MMSECNPTVEAGEAVTILSYFQTAGDLAQILQAVVLVVVEEVRKPEGHLLYPPAKCHTQVYIYGEGVKIYAVKSG